MPLSFRIPGASLLVAAVFSLLSACGGGSGGGGSSPVVPAPGFSVTVDHAELRFDGDEGTGLSPQAVLGSGTGPLPSAIFTGALDLGTSVDHVTVEVVGAQLKFTVFPKSNLAAGEYRGSVQLFACADAKCAQHFAGSPTNVPYTITIRKGLVVAPATLNLAAPSGAISTREFTVQLPPGQAAFSVSSSANWISASNVTAGGFTVTTIPLPPGNYSGSLSISVPGKNITVPVSYTVQGDASTISTITPDPSSLNFTATASLAAGTRQINVTLPAWSTELSADIQYPAGSAQNWLSVAKTGERQITVSATAANLVAGNYTAQVQLKSGYLTSPVLVPVAFTVGAPVWQTSGKLAFVVRGDTTPGQLWSEIQIDTPNLPGQTWNASTSSSWLKLMNTSGATGSAKLLVAVDLAELAKLPNFASQASDVTLTATSGKPPATKLTFTLDKNLPEINFVSPYTRLPGESGPLIVRGRGFDGAPNLPQVLSAGGASVQSITRVNDTQLLLQVAGAPQGQATFTLNNALSVATGSATLKVIPQGSFAYRAIPTKGMKGSIHFDPARQSIYSTNKALTSLMRFAYADGNWSITAASVPSIESAAMSPDGKSLVATSTSGNLSLLDPASLAIQASYSTSYIGGYALNSLPTLAMTNNGKAFFQGSTWASGMAYFDLVTRQFGALPGGALRYEFYSGPWFNVSGDGDRLVIVQSASISPSPRMLYMDSSSEAPKTNPAGLEFWYEAAQSLHGERFIEGTYKVWDRNFNLIGNTDMPDTAYFGRTPVFSPDGNRVYILAYHTGFSPSSPLRPRVYVFDTSKKLITTTSLPVMGYFDLADYPTCADSSYECNTRALGTISPDGKTLFFIGDANLIVAPIPALQGVAAPSPIQRAHAGSNIVPDVMVPHQLKPAGK